LKRGGEGFGLSFSLLPSLGKYGSWKVTIRGAVLVFAPLFVPSLDPFALTGGGDLVGELINLSGLARPPVGLKRKRVLLSPIKGMAL
jgi:hypothetical protein